MNMTTDDLKALDRMADDLSLIAERLRDDEDGRPTSASASVRKASYLLQDAVTEMMESYAKQKGFALVSGSIEVLRERHV